MAQKIGIWGCLILGAFSLIMTFVQHGLDDPMRFMGGAALILIGLSFWLFRKNAEQQEKGND